MTRAEIDKMIEDSTDDKYVSQAYSFTHKKMNNVFVSKPYMQAGEKVLIVDDFLADGFVNPNVRIGYQVPSDARERQSREVIDDIVEFDNGNFFAVVLVRVFVEPNYCCFDFFHG